MEGSFKCDCELGFRKNFSGECVDINECQNPTLCHIDAVCVNLEGGYECKCKPGYIGTGKMCGMFDVCKAGKHDCHEHAYCDGISELGKYSCECKGGFYGDGKRCFDVDECVEGLADCKDSESCLNLPGGYKCICPDG